MAYSVHSEVLKMRTLGSIKSTVTFWFIHEIAKTLESFPLSFGWKISFFKWITLKISRYFALPEQLWATWSTYDKRFRMVQHSEFQTQNDSFFVSYTFNHPHDDGF